MVVYLLRWVISEPGSGQWGRQNERYDVTVGSQGDQLDVWLCEVSDGLYRKSTSGGGGGIYLLALPFLLFPIRQCPAINTPGWPGLRWSLGKLDPMLVSSEMQWEEPDLWHLSQTVGALWVCCCCDSCDGANGQGSEIQVKMRDSEKVQKHWLMKSSNLAFS